MNVYELRSALAGNLGLDAGPHREPMSLVSPVKFRIVKLQPASVPFVTGPPAVCADLMGSSLKARANDAI